MLALFSLGITNLPRAQAQEASLPEYQAKALFLYNFAKFVEWPASKFSSTNAPLVIGVFGQNPFDDHLENAVRGKQINGRTILVRQVADAPEVQQCHILFVGSGERRRLDDVFKAAETGSVLTVGETVGFLESGGMINFYLESGGAAGKRVRFEIDDRVARRANLRMSSKLLNLGRRARTEGGQ
jgi:hypothetical protein